jgi:hypothetical protein
LNIVILMAEVKTRAKTLGEALESDDWQGVLYEGAKFTSQGHTIYRVVDKEGGYIRVVPCSFEVVPEERREGQEPQRTLVEGDSVGILLRQHENDLPYTS